MSKQQRIEHQQYIARLMADALMLMMYQTEREHGPSRAQTEFVTKLGEARDAAKKLAEAVPSIVE